MGNSLKPVVHLADDDDDLRHALAQGLEIEGLPVVLHNTPENLLSQISHMDYAVIVSDIRMPGMDGFELLKSALAIDFDLARHPDHRPWRRADGRRRHAGRRL